ncbi:MAG: type II toxin-antitoxin system PemK/MazF family toxin [Ruminococcaceae bacterium]|nr:type II toxin-antitoxin system PemK/MazF family toxin [Oscillospiraceae bacterium]
MSKKTEPKHPYKVIYSLRWINSSDLIISEDYQRDEHKSREAQIVADFSEYVANEPKVSRRGGKYYVYDGQHTILARELLNGGETLDIYCKVYENLTEEDEAMLFAKQTGVSSKPTSGQRMKAYIFAKDDDAMAFKDATESAGIMLDLTGSRNENHLCCINTAWKEYKRVGQEHYIEGMSIIKEAWNAEGDSLKLYIVRAVISFVFAYRGKYDRRRLIRCLHNTKDPNIITNRIKSDIENPGIKKFIKPIFDIYNAFSPIGALPVAF